MADQPTSPTPPVDASAERRLDLAQRLLAMTYHCDTGLLRLLPGALPDGLPFELPLPDGARILGALSVASRDQPDQHRPLATILMEMPHTAEQGAQRLSVALEAQGWAQNIMPPRMCGGFAHVMPNHQFMRFALAASDYTLTISPLPSANVQPTTFSIMAQRDWPRQIHDYFHDQRELIPMLLPPAGATQQSGDGGGGSGRRYVNAYLSTDAPIAEVMATYDRQLERANWRRRSSETSRSVGGSYWSFSDNEGTEWRGSLAVFGDPDRPRDYMAFLQIETDADVNGFARWQSHSTIQG
ncbi:MAG TPA: hypothetical protein VHI51_13935 [Ktedonobacterales bacterium]|nr:hypothetical protein [Ktedonobacterales bacterium]